MKRTYENFPGLVCYTNGHSEVMQRTETGAYRCPECRFTVRLNAFVAPEFWYRGTRANHRPICADHPSLPFCESCNSGMVVHSGIANLDYKARAVWFSCLKGESIVHRFQSYFVEIPADELAALMQEYDEWCERQQGPPGKKLLH